MRLVVTGGSGFIGSRIVDRLATRGDVVQVVDLMPRRDGVLEEPVSVLDLDGLACAVRGADVVVHLAGFVRERMRRDPDAGMRLQVDGTRNVLEACASARVDRVILASSFYVYEGCPDEAVDEDSIIDSTTLEPFALGKLRSEQLCGEYAARAATTFTVLRIGSAYGPGGSNAVRTFLESGFGCGRIEVWGDGLRRNQYTFVDDIALGAVAALDHLDASRNQIFNLVAPSITTTRDLASTLSVEFGFDIAFRTDRLEGPSFPYMRSEKATALLGWRARPLVDGLGATASEVRNRLSLVTA